MRSRLGFLLAALVACGGKKDEPVGAPEPPRDAASVVDAAVDWKARCRPALAAAAQQPLARRPRELIDHCQPCGDWSALLRWDIRGDDGGPSRDAIEATLERCTAWCSAAAKQRFLGTLDDARGKRVRTPWRHLGELCGDAVSASPDARFLSAPYFALDRIARAASTDAELAKLLAAIEIPLPPVSLTGDGVTVPLAPVTRPETGRAQITVAAGRVQYVGLLPRARLASTGVVVDHGGVEPYPGALTPTAQLAAALARLPGEPITIIAPIGLPAVRVAEVLVGPSQFVLAAEVRAAPQGWSLLGHVPVTLVAAARDARPVSLSIALSDPRSIDAALETLKTATSQQLAAPRLTIARTGGATVSDLAKLLGAFAYRDARQVTVSIR